MSRKAYRETEAMLARLQSVGISCQHAEALRRISMTLQRWFEAECNGEVERDETDGKTYRYIVARRWPVPDREKGANARLAKIMAGYPTLAAYVQTDPRGCALYILRPGDVPAGEDASTYYSRGLAVYR